MREVETLGLVGDKLVVPGLKVRKVKGLGSSR